MSPDSVQPEQLQAELSSLDGLVSRARHDLAQGSVLDLTSLERRVDALCAGIQTLPPELARPFAGQLMALFTDLEALSAQIQEGRDALAAELGDLGRRSSAARAYGRGT